MSEDETIEILNTFKLRQKTKNYNKLSLEDVQAIETILDLYQKEKEKNKELEKKLKIAKQLYNDSCICIATECVEKDKIRNVFNNKIMKEKQNIINLHLLKEEDDFNNSFAINAVESKINELIKLEKELLEEN